jgi:hypothetical protein
LIELLPDDLGQLPEGAGQLRFLVGFHGESLRLRALRRRR